MTAGINGELIRNIIIPEFKAGSYYNSLDKGADAIFEVLKGNTKVLEKNRAILCLYLDCYFIIILIVLASRGNKGGGNFRGGGGFGFRRYHYSGAA